MWMIEQVYTSCLQAQKGTLHLMSLIYLTEGISIADYLLKWMLVRSNKPCTVTQMGTLLLRHSQSDRFLFLIVKLPWFN